MSLLQIWLETDRVRVAVDTIGKMHGPNIERAEMSKLIPLTHAGVVFAYRGADLAFFQVLAQLLLTPSNDSFDAICEVMPTRCMHAHTQWPPGVPSAVGEFQLAVVGYSDLLNAMAAVIFIIDLSTGAAQRRPVFRPGVAAPGFKAIPHLDTDAGMHALASMQVAWMAENAPNEKTGGRLIVAEVEREKMTIRDAGNIVG